MSNQLGGELQYLEVNGKLRFVSPNLNALLIKEMLRNPNNIIQEQLLLNVPRFSIVITNNE